jgi:hypothetical protein
MFLGIGPFFDGDLLVATEDRPDARRKHERGEDRKDDPIRIVAVVRERPGRLRRRRNSCRR